MSRQWRFNGGMRVVGIVEEVGQGVSGDLVIWVAFVGRRWQAELIKGFVRMIAAPRAGGNAVLAARRIVRGCHQICGTQIRFETYGWTTGPWNNLGGSGLDAAERDMFFTGNGCCEKACH